MGNYFKLGLFIAIVVMMVTALSAAEEPGWVSTTSDCQVYVAKSANSNISWSGKCVDGFAEGPGTLIWSNGTRYEGEMYAGTITGQGKFSWVNGDWYQGEFKNGRREGNGIQYLSCSGSYQGEFHNGLMDGYGVLITSNGNRYEGEFQRGVMHGLGVRQYADGSRYEGEFKFNQEEGIGSLTLANHAHYEGEFQNGKPDGHALVTYPDGGVYEGTYVDGHADGRGIMSKPNGERDVGFFKDNNKGVLKLISSIGPPLYESCNTFCSTSSLSCSSTGASKIPPDDPNYQQRMIDASVACGREIQLCQTSCERHNPTVQDIKGIIVVGEIDETTVPDSTQGKTDTSKAEKKAAKPLVDFATAQADATAELRARLAKMRPQLQSVQQKVATLPQVSVKDFSRDNRNSNKCPSVAKN